jgi:hypothetical protein
MLFLCHEFRDNMQLLAHEARLYLSFLLGF